MDGGPDQPPRQLDGPGEARQRWRITFRRGPSAAPVAQREYIEAWERGMSASGLPILMGSGATPRPRLAFAAPLPLGMVAEREIADLFLVDRLAIGDVRERLESHLPEGHALLDLHDVWLGEPGLQAQVSAADYRVTLADPASSAEDLRGAARRLLAADALPRTREKGGGAVSYDLRPLLGDIVVLDGESPPRLRIRTMFHVERGSGRPEEVLAALSELLGEVLTATETVRECVILDAARLRPTATEARDNGPRRASQSRRRPTR